MMRTIVWLAALAACGGNVQVPSSDASADASSDVAVESSEVDAAAVEAGDDASCIACDPAVCAYNVCTHEIATPAEGCAICGCGYVNGALCGADGGDQ